MLSNASPDLKYVSTCTITMISLVTTNARSDANNTNSVNIMPAED